MFKVIFSSSLGAPRLALVDVARDMADLEWQINAVAKVIGDQYWVADVFNADDTHNKRFTWKRETIVQVV